MTLRFDVLDALAKPRRDYTIYMEIIPPADLLAYLIAAYANSNGGLIIIGAIHSSEGLHIGGLRPTIKLAPLAEQAILLLSCRPGIEYAHTKFLGKRFFGVRVSKSQEKILLFEKEYKAVGDAIVEIKPDFFTSKQNGYLRLEQMSLFISHLKQKASRAGSALFNHYLGLLKIIDRFAPTLFPDGPKTPTSIAEGKIMSRVVFSSAIDNFESYIGALLLEINLAKPETMKSNHTVTIEEVLNCKDMAEFVKYVSKKRNARLQKGTITDFIKENRALAVLRIITHEIQDEIEQIFQIRHLYTHRNGFVDEKFQLHFKAAPRIGEEFLLSTDEMLEKLNYLLDTAHRLDAAACAKYHLA